MSGKIVSSAPRVHACNPGWTTDGMYWHPPAPHAFAPGDVWECDDCRRQWVAMDARSNHATSGQRSIGAVEWRPNTMHQEWTPRLPRWLRRKRRRAVKSGEPQ